MRVWFTSVLSVYSWCVTALTLVIHQSLSVGMTYSCPPSVFLHPSFPLSLVKTVLSWPQFKSRHDSWRCHLAAFSFSHLPLSPSLSGDRWTQWGAWHDRFRCHLTATWPSSIPTPPPRALTPFPLSSMHSHPLSQTLSGDLLRCRHDRCRCHRVSPCLRLMTSWLPAVCDMTGVDVTYKWTSLPLSPL